jgi:hypothetical protein
MLTRFWTLIDSNSLDAKAVVAITWLNREASRALCQLTNFSNRNPIIDLTKPERVS